MTPAGQMRLVNSLDCAVAQLSRRAKLIFSGGDMRRRVEYCFVDSVECSEPCKIESSIQQNE